MSDTVTSAFLTDAVVAEAIGRLDDAWPAKPPISDIEDADGHQYVDLVMEGGGTLGIALAGYIYALEHAGIRFKSIGGTSAGAITATLLASLRPPAEPKAPAIVEVLSAMDMGSFLYGPRSARKAVLRCSRGSSFPKLALPVLFSLRTLWKNLGLHPGDEFRNWLKRTLDGAGVRTWNDLVARMRSLPDGLVHVKRESGERVALRVPGGEVTDAGQLFDPALKMVTADVTTKTKVEFPRMADLYFKSPGAMSPADFVRASMSIPFVFHPYAAASVPQGDEAKTRWDDLTSYTGTLPQRAFFLDGGILSNFPIQLFHRMGSIPRCPTLGVRLGPNRGVARIDTVMRLGGQMFNTSRAGADYDFLARNPEYRMLVQRIDTGDISWLDFEMPIDTQVELFRHGVKAAVHFLLERFDWNKYKRLRAQLAGIEMPTDLAPIDPPNAPVSGVTGAGAA